MPLRRFDAAALHAALDERRIAESLSWTGATRAMWEQSSVLNATRRDHPISPSTLTGMASSGRTSCQHALFMLRWLDRTPESFLVGPGDPGRALPAAGADQRPRWSLKLLHACLDEQRRADGLTWSALAELLGCTPNRLTALRTARFATAMDLAMRCTQWLGRPAADFVYPASW